MIVRGPARTSCRAALAAGALLAVVAVGCGPSFYEIPIETPIQPKLDVSPFQRVLVVGFVAGGSEDLDTNQETVRLLRSQLRTKSSLRVIDADIMPLAEIAQDQNAQNAQTAASNTVLPNRGGAEEAGSPPNTASGGSGSPTAGGSGSATAGGSGSASGSGNDNGGSHGGGGPVLTAAGSHTDPSQAAGSHPTPAPTDHVSATVMPLPKAIREERDLEPYERLFANTAYWKKIGEEYQNPLIVTGTVLFTPHSKAGYVQREQDYIDAYGRHRVVPMRTYMERKGFILRPKFVFIDGRTGATMYSESHREEILYNAQQNTPALSSYFELMDRIVPDFLSALSSQKIKGTRVLLK